MHYVLLYTLIALTLGTLAYYIGKHRIGYISVPALGAGILLVWFMPQAMIVIGNDYFPDQGKFTVLMMAVASFVCLVLGWNLGAKTYRAAYPSVPGRRATPLANAILSIQKQRLYIMVGVFVAFAALVQIAIARQPPEALLARQPSGLITILRLLSIVNPVAFFLAMTTFLLKRNVVTAGLLLVAAATFFIPILLNFKRNDIFELGAVIVFAFWATKRFSIPRLMLPVLAVLGVFILFGAAEVRRGTGYSLNASGTLEAETISVEKVLSIDWGEVLEKAATSQSYEIVNAIYVMDYATKNELPTFGIRLWNQFIFRWVPGQFIGVERKRSLVVDVSSTRGALADRGLTWQVGTTSTGFTEVYLDFSYLSVVIFFLMAFMSRRAYDRGLAGDIASAAVYPTLGILCVISLSHGGYSFFLALPAIWGMKYGIKVLANQRMPVELRKVSSGSQGIDVIGKYGEFPTQYGRAV